MKTVTVRELRNEFGRLAKWREAGGTIQIWKRGKPFARVLPEPKPKTFVGACPSSFPWPRDIDDPVDVAKTKPKAYRHARSHYFTPVWEGNQ